MSPPLPAGAGRDRGGLRRAGKAPVARGMAARNPGTKLGKGPGLRGGPGRDNAERGGGGSLAARPRASSTGVSPAGCGLRGAASRPGCLPP